MNRTIKFRGKGLYSDKWIAGYYLVNRGDHFITPDEIVNPLVHWSDYQVAPDTIGQFTGLVDKHGTEIYEGDILESEVHKAHYVGFCDGGFDLIEPNEERLGLGRLSIYAQHMQVIGNIHDNPELI